VQVDVAGATGFLIACPTISSVATAHIAGFSQEAASNLSTSGIAQTQNLTNKVPNQTNAVITPIGAPPNDGNCGVQLAIPQASFQAKFGDSSDNTLAVLAQAQVSGIFGLTKDATTGFWYVDNHITATASGACVEVVSLIDPVGTLNGRVEIIVLNAAQQLSA
jgi:hypothetical protein